MEFGGYVAPPSHLNKLSKKKVPESRPAELRTVPDCDYSLFRYSPFALPFVLLILVSACVLLGLTFWQGPFGFIRGKNGVRDGVPRDWEFSDGSYKEAGLGKGLKGLRAANFVCGMTPIIFLIFALRAGLRPTFLRILFWTIAFFLFALGCMSSVSFALGLDQVNRIIDCPTKLTFDPTNYNQQPNFKPLYNSCRFRIQISTAAVVADMAQALSAFILSVLLVYTSLDGTYSWGPGNIPVEESANQPHISFPPPSPFTHIAETRRLYVYIATAFATAFIIIAFILMLKLHELRNRPKPINYRNQVVEDSGWQAANNRYRVAMCGFCISACVLSFVDMYMIKRRFVSYTLASFYFWLFIGFLVLFAMDVRDLGKTKTLGCGLQGSAVVPVLCVYWQFYGTCWMDWCVLFLIMLYVCYEFFYRIFATYDTYYFYADSEWLRNHSLFVEQTDREAYDWKRYTMDTGKEYYYSPSLGISTCTRPKNFVEPEGFVQPPVMTPFTPQPVFYTSPAPVYSTPGVYTSPGVAPAVPM